MFFSKGRQGLSRVLIVEDEPLLAFDTERALQHAGYDVVATVDRFRDAEAVIANDGAIDLLIVDIRLRGARSGLDLARHASARGIAVLFATASCPDEAQAMGIALGVLAKPFELRSLARAIAVCGRLLAGQPAGRLPAGLTLFPRP
ncbi:MAG TPA: response regulator [Sphingobium sp.]|nr:response regulator [Sphingobium sp.]